MRTHKCLPTYNLILQHDLLKSQQSDRLNSQMGEQNWRLKLVSVQARSPTPDLILPYLTSLIHHSSPLSISSPLSFLYKKEGKKEKPNNRWAPIYLTLTSIPLLLPEPLFLKCSSCRNLLMAGSISWQHAEGGSVSTFALSWPTRAKAPPWPSGHSIILYYLQCMYCSWKLPCLLVHLFIICHLLHELEAPWDQRPCLFSSLLQKNTYYVADTQHLQN